MKTRRAWLPPLIWSIAIIVGVIVLVRESETAREVISETAVTVLQVLTTPFIMEASLALLGLCIVIAINCYRENKEGDGWVYLEQKSPSADGRAADDPPHRHDAVVWQEKPASFDETEAGLGVVEGYLDLGLAEDALRELSSLPDSVQSAAHAALHRSRALAMCGRQVEALAAFDRLASEHPQHVAAHVDAAIKIAVWLHDNQKPPADSSRWAERCRALDKDALLRLPSGHPLRRTADH